MCNEAARRIALGELRTDWDETRIPLVFPEGVPNMAPLDSFRITDPTIIIRGVDGRADEAECVTRRWSWPGAGGRPVYNFRSDGRDLRSGRCLIPVDSFFEFTKPADPKAKRKDKWAFRLVGHDWFCIAGLWRKDASVGEAFTMLTCEPGPDIAPVHDRQVCVLQPEDWAAWLFLTKPEEELLRSLPAGTLVVEVVREGKD